MVILQTFFPLRNVIRNQGKWNGVEVSIKMLNRDTVPLTMQQRLEVKNMRDIRHQNLTSFVGACCDSPNVCILVETAPKVGPVCMCEGCMYILLNGLMLHSRSVPPSHSPSPPSLPSSRVVWMTFSPVMLLTWTGTSSMPSSRYQAFL